MSRDLEHLTADGGNVDCIDPSSQAFFIQFPKLNSNHQHVQSLYSQSKLSCTKTKLERPTSSKKTSIVTSKIVQPIRIQTLQLEGDHSQNSQITRQFRSLSQELTIENMIPKSKHRVYLDRLVRAGILKQSKMDNQRISRSTELDNQVIKKFRLIARSLSPPIINLNSLEYSLPPHECKQRTHRLLYAVQGFQYQIRGRPQNNRVFLGE